MQNAESTPQDPLFAVFNGSEEITEEMYQEVLDFIAYAKEKEAEK